MENREIGNEMKYKILVKRITDLYPPYGTWEEWLRTDKAESAQQMVLHLERQGHEAQSVLIGQSATPEAQADLDETAAIQEAMIERIRKDLLDNISADLLPEPESEPETPRLSVVFGRDS